jgi:uncharacterized protein YeaO (DUF488 family)
MIRIKRIYDIPSKDDGLRILVDRLWPRGLKRETAAIDHWLKDIAPSPDLRIWFAHDPKKWEEFQIRYRLELAAPGHAEAMKQIQSLIGDRRTSLLFAARDLDVNHAAVLAQVLSETLRI